MHALMINSAPHIEVSLPIRVLVADDSDVMRRTVTRYLSTRSEVKVVGEAGNFEEAARLVEEFRPDVVVIDVRMSRLVDSQTRDIKQICDCRIIAISASVDGETVT
jgi:chemotaxis response regulator CheB